MIELNYKFKDARLWQEAITHKSFHYENKEEFDFNNERLEFLGDSVLDLVISQWLLGRYPELPEGMLTKIRANLVNEQSLFDISQELNLKEIIKVGQGEIVNWSRGERRISGSAVEAILGAIFLDSNYEEVKKIIFEVFSDKMNSVDLTDVDKQDFKSKLQERIQKQNNTTPTYIVVDESGEDHSKTFVVQVKMEEKVLAESSGKSKKIASQNAAKKALEGLL